MSNQLAGDTGKPGIHVGSKDVEKTEALGTITLLSKRGDKQIEATQTSPSTLYSECLIRSVRYEQLRQDKREEIKAELHELKQIADKYDIELTELI